MSTQIIGNNLFSNKIEQSPLKSNFQLCSNFNMDMERVFMRFDWLKYICMRFDWLKYVCMRLDWLKYVCMRLDWLKYVCMRLEHYLQEEQ